MQLQNLNDVPQPVVLKDVKTEPKDMMEDTSKRSELEELTKQELIEKVMAYERQMENTGMRRLSAVKQEPENEEMKDVQCKSYILLFEFKKHGSSLVSNDMM
jgi:uncharacterized protein YcbK (DUF882 family)